MREEVLRPEQLIQPLFVDEEIGQRRELAAMPGQQVLPIGEVAEECAQLEASGVRAVLLFGIPSSKDPLGSQAYARDGVVQRAVREAKGVSGLVVITDLCLCEYTDHGHCGVLRDGCVDNDATLDLYARTALSQAEAGADIVAPSGMMDGQVAAIRRALDGAGRSDTAIMAYSAKYASCFYGPFREAVQSALVHGDRRSHQMDPSNGREALREMRADVSEGADMVMVKPAMPYLDIIREGRRALDVPICAYQVSGEYAMIAAAAERGALDRQAAMMESLTCIRRAGADLIITYFAKEAAELLGGGNER